VLHADVAPWLVEYPQCYRSLDVAILKIRQQQKIAIEQQKILAEWLWT
jgi:hypothetical protein